MLQYHPLDKAKMLDIAQHIKPDDNFTILEFGVATGNTMCAMLDALIEVGKYPRNVFGFDSFEGLPQEDVSATPNAEWFPTAFNIVSELHNKGIETTTEKGVEMIRQRFYQYPFDVKLIVGWYSNLTLKTVIDNNILPASYIHIDCDMYISAYQALRWLAENDLIRDECIIRYDDWKDDWNMGEPKAHLQILREFPYKYEFIPSVYPGNVIFRFFK